LSLFAWADDLTEINAETWQVLDDLGLADKADMPANSLSHGDQRLLEIGIALATRPRLILLDEPLAGLSAGERTRIAGLIRCLAGQITVVLIEHDIDRVLALSDTISVPHQGRRIFPTSRCRRTWTWRPCARDDQLSGGERQMLAIGRSLQELRRHAALLLVEQNAQLALGLADRAYVLSNGAVEYRGPSAELARNLDLRVKLLGV
jgi:ABC-type branched-subunit amino acid transport system ATPase component